MKNKTTYWWPVFASDKFEKILGAGHAQQETYVVLANSLVVCDPLIFSNLSDAKTGHQYVVLFFELIYDERTLGFLVLRVTLLNINNVTIFVNN